MTRNKFTPQNDSDRAAQNAAHDLINEGLDEVMGVAMTPYFSRASDETFMHCRLCDEFEGHTDTCPIPWIDHWLADGKEESARVAGNVRHVQNMLERWNA